jgi:predicted O-methyltransferase YrrM
MENEDLLEWVKEGTWPQKKTEQACWGLINQYRSLGDSITGIEIGVQYGNNSIMLMQECPNITKLHGIDPYIEYQDWNGPVTQATQDRTHGIVRDNLKSMVDDRYELIRAFSRDVNNRFTDGAFDFVFIDGDHSALGVLADLICYEPKVRKGGIVSGHDVGLDGIRTALQIWGHVSGMELSRITVVENNSWFWVK